MLHFSRFQTIAILASVLIGLIFAMPNVLPPVAQGILKESIGAKSMTLGLDLQGGVNIVLELDRKDFKGNLLKQLASDVRVNLREAKVGYKGIMQTENGVSVRISNVADADKVKTALTKLLQPLSTGLLSAGVAGNLFEYSSQDDLQILTFSELGFNSKVATAIAQSLKIVENRLNGLGTTEPTIQQQGKDRIAIQF